MLLKSTEKGSFLLGLSIDLTIAEVIITSYSEEETRYKTPKVKFAKPNLKHLCYGAMTSIGRDSYSSSRSYKRQEDITF